MSQSTDPKPTLEGLIQSIERVLLLITSHMIVTEESFAAFRDKPPHVHSYRGRDLLVNVNASCYHRAIQLSTHSNVPIGLIRKVLATELTLPLNKFRLIFQSKSLQMKADARRLSQLDVEGNIVLTIRNLTASAQQGLQSAFANRNERGEQSLPGSIVVASDGIFELIFGLTQLPFDNIRTLSRRLISLLPTSPRLIEQYNQLCGITTADKSVTPSSFSQICDLNSISSFQLLYHLEVIHSLLAPSYDIDSASCLLFRTNFIRVGGIAFIIEVFTSAVLSDLDATARQRCLCKALTLLRLLVTSEAESKTAQFIPVVVSSRPYTPAKQYSTTTMAGVTNYHYDSDSDGDEATFVSHIESQQTSFFSSTRPAQHVPDDEPVLTQQSSSELSRSDSVGSQSMTEDSLQNLVSMLLNLIWASATGRMHTSSFQEDVLNQMPSSPADSYSLELATEAISLLNFLINSHPTLIDVIFQHKYISLIIVDVLISSNPQLRRQARQCFGTFVLFTSSSNDLPPYCKLLKILLSARVPFWHLGGQTTSRRKEDVANQMYCLEYFGLLSDLLAQLRLSSFDLEKFPEFQLNDMLESELRWFTELEPFPDTDAVTDTLLAGHAHLLSTLLSFESIDKVSLGLISGADFVRLLVDKFLFPESKLIYDALQSGDDLPVTDVLHQSQSAQSRDGVFRVLIELCRNCIENLVLLGDLLGRYHFSENETMGKWEFQPPVNERQAYGFVGLKNAGATCYMNSVLQQLCNIIPVRTAILAVDDERFEDSEPHQALETPSLNSVEVAPKPAIKRSDSMFYNLQCMFGHLLDSKRQFYVPDVCCFRSSFISKFTLM
jgi:ubiquitin carboxyl-terminal hydrolase 9/24